MNSAARTMSRAPVSGTDRYTARGGAVETGAEAAARLDSGPGSSLGQPPAAASSRAGRRDHIAVRLADLALGHDIDAVGDLHASS